MPKKVRRRKRISQKERTSLRNDFYYYVQKVFNFFHPDQPMISSWHIKSVTLALTHYSKLLINLPPRTLKSLICTTSYATWSIGQNPNNKIIIATYGEFLSRSFMEDCKTVFDSEWYQDAFPEVKIIKRTMKRVQTDKFGHIITTSMSGALTGTGCNILIVDDPHKAVDFFSPHILHKSCQWFEVALISRLNNFKTAKIVVIMQRLHRFDLTGFIIKNMQNFFHLAIPYYTEKTRKFTIANQEFSMKGNQYIYDHFKDIDTMVATETIASQYMQEPVHQFALFDIKQIQFIQIHFSQGQIYQSWDTAISERDYSSYSVCTVWTVYDNKFILVDFLKMRLSYKNLLGYAMSFCAKYPKSTIIIEDKFTGSVLAEELEVIYDVARVVPSVSKSQRAMQILNLMPSVFISEDLPQALSNEFLYDLDVFPYGKSDDVVDSMTQFLIYTSRHHCGIR